MFKYQVVSKMMRNRIGLYFIIFLLSLIISGCDTTKSLQINLLDKNQLKRIDSGLSFNNLSNFQITVATHLSIRELEFSYLEVIKKDKEDFFVAALMFSGPSIFNYKTVGRVVVDSYISSFLKKMKFSKRLLKMLVAIYLDVFEVYKKSDVLYKSFENDVLIQYDSKSLRKKQIITFDKEKNVIISRICFNGKKKIFEIDYSDYKKFNDIFIPFKIDVHEFKHNLKLKIQIKDIKNIENN